MMAKPWYQSKTLWVNWLVAVLSAGVILLDAVAADQLPLPVTPDAAMVALALGVVNLVLRYLTDQPIE